MKKRLVFALFLGLIAGPAAGSRGVQAQDNVPGFPTVGRMQILNRTRAEAVPVVVHGSADPVPVVVLSAPAAPAARQMWEYREVRVKPEESALAALSAAGLEGWEAVGSAVGVDDAVVWVLKRPR
jgi:hypothetical protein